MFPTGDKSKTARDTWANLIPNPYQPDRKWRALHAARGKQNLQTKYLHIFHRISPQNFKKFRNQSLQVKMQKSFQLLKIR